ncbi:MAG: hypothetical protein LH614_09585 [Pyrinomonadaceae bacterium]|nr:hypothetical protein [Pyrinomonadaceae bacterium]
MRTAELGKIVIIRVLYLQRKIKLRILKDSPRRRDLSLRHQPKPTGFNEFISKNKETIKL